MNGNWKNMNVVTFIYVKLQYRPIFHEQPEREHVTLRGYVTELG